MPDSLLATWKEKFSFTESAEREFNGLPPEVQKAFLKAFPEFSKHPWRATPTLDVDHLRDMPSRWRLKVAGGHRGIYRSLQGVPDFEMFETRDQVYEKLRRYFNSRP